MLHITNGDSASSRVSEAGIVGMIVPWRDVLHEGPVPAGLDLNDLRSVRAGYLSAEGWDAYERVLTMLEERDEALTAYRDHDEVVLWFEHDLYDQLQLIQILDWFATQRSATADVDETVLSLVGPDEYLSLVPPERLGQLFAERKAVTSTQLALAVEAWKAFSSPTPTDVLAVLGGDLSALPYLGAALWRHLEEFPDTRTGLSRSERQALEAIADGAATLTDAFRSAHLEREDPLFLGDAIFSSYLERLSAGESPLILTDEGRPIRSPRRGEDESTFWRSRAEVTAVGRSVLEGRTDWLRIHDIDRWLGGVHLLAAESIWRWDAARKTLVHGGS